MAIDININNESAIDNIQDSLSDFNNIYTELATDMVNNLKQYQDQSYWNYDSIETELTIYTQYTDTDPNNYYTQTFYEFYEAQLNRSIHSDGDWKDFCKTFREQCINNNVHKNIDLWSYLTVFLNEMKDSISSEQHIHLSNPTFDAPAIENDGFLEAKPIVQGHITDTTSLSEEDQQELQNLLDGLQPDDEELQPGYGYDMAFNITEAITHYVELTVQSLITSNAVNVLNKMGINEDTLEIAQKIIDIADSAIFKIKAIIPCIPKNIMFTPDFTSAMTSITTSLKDMFMAMYISVENMYYETINQAITNLPSLEEIQKDLIDEAINIGIALIDQQCIKYTGHTLVELYYMCQKYIALYQQYREVRKQMRELEAEGYDVDIKASFSWNSDEVKRQLIEELKAASDMIFNAFLIIQIRDAFYNIKGLIAEFNNIDLKVLVEGMNSLQDLMDLLDEIGLNENSWTVSLAEAIEIGINDFQNKYRGLTRQVEAIAAATGVQIANTLVSNIGINMEGEGVSKAFDFKSNLDDDPESEFGITLVIYKNPLIERIQKNLTGILTGAEDNQGHKLFDAGQVLNIMTQLKEAYNLRKDRDIDLGDFIFKIHFEIEGFNSNIPITTDVYENIMQVLKDYEAQKEADKINAMNTLELGVVTEEYTYDPDMVKRRPTLQLVHDIYALMQKFFPILKVFATLVSNYKINKAKVQNNSKGNIFAMRRVLAKINNLINYLNTDQKNFYTVRTLKTFDYIDRNIRFIDYYDINPIEEGDDNRQLKEKDITSCTFDINVEETKKLYNYLSENNLDNKTLKLENETTLYIDVDALKEQREEVDEGINALKNFFGEDAHLFVSYPETNVKDGTYDGIDKIEVLENEIYYSDSSLPVIGSQILRAYQKNKDVSV